MYDSTKDFLELRYEHRAHEKKWMAEKDRLLRELDMCKYQMNVTGENNLLNVSASTGSGRVRHDEEIQVRVLNIGHVSVIRISDGVLGRIFVYL